MAAVIALVPSTMAAYDFMVDGIYYNKNGTQATVTYKSTYHHSYSGDVVIPETVTYKGTTYSVTAIGSEAFCYCTDPLTVTIPNSVTKIHDEAFINCLGLTSVNIPSSVTSIGNYVFYGCKSLPTLVIPNSVTKIGTYALSNCESLVDLTLPSSITSISADAFNSSHIVNVHISDLKAFCKISFGNDFSTPLECAENLYVNGVLMNDLVLPETVTTINDYAFSGFQGLTSVTIPSSLTSIGDFVFTFCDNIAAVYINDLAAWCRISFKSTYSNPLGFAHHLYLNGEEIKDLIIPESITAIGDYTFYSASSFESVTFHQSITRIGTLAFAGCRNLKSPSFPESLKNIGTSAFANCMGITSIYIPESVTSIGSSAFSRCPEVTSIEVAPGNTVYDSRDNCNAIIKTSSNTLMTGCRNTVIPETVTTIGSSAFIYCTALTSITIPESVTAINSNAFTYCSGLTRIDIGKSVTIIGSNAFTYCSGLTRIDIGESVTKIGNDAFRACTNLASITIPESVVTLGESVFTSCPSITKVVCQGTTPPTVSYGPCSSSTYEMATLFVPEEALQTYAGHEAWGQFNHIVPFIGSGPGDTNGDGHINISDAILLISMMTNGMELPAYVDVNGDGNTDISDCIALINMLTGAN